MIKKKVGINGTKIAKNLYSAIPALDVMLSPKIVILIILSVFPDDDPDDDPLAHPDWGP